MVSITTLINPVMVILSQKYHHLYSLKFNILLTVISSFDRILENETFKLISDHCNHQKLPISTTQTIVFDIVLQGFLFSLSLSFALSPFLGIYIRNPCKGYLCDILFHQNPSLGLDKLLEMSSRIGYCFPQLASIYWLY